MDVQRFLIGLGLIILVAGIMWPILTRIGLGRLPGDIVFQRGGANVLFSAGHLHHHQHRAERRNVAIQPLRSRPGCGRNFARRKLRQHDRSVSSCEFNRLIDGFCGKGFPAVDLAHIDLARGQQRPEQHGGRVCRRQHGLRFNPALELLV